MTRVCFFFSFSWLLFFIFYFIFFCVSLLSERASPHNRLYIWYVYTRRPLCLYHSLRIAWSPLDSAPRALTPPKVQCETSCSQAHPDLCWQCWRILVTSRIVFWWESCCRQSRILEEGLNWAVFSVCEVYLSLWVPCKCWAVDAIRKMGKDKEKCGSVECRVIGDKEIAQPAGAGLSLWISWSCL